MTNEEAAAAIAALAAHGTYRAAAAALGIAPSTFQSRIKAARRLSMIAPHAEGVPAPGFITTRRNVVLDEDGKVKRQSIGTRPSWGDEYEVPAGHVVKGESALVDQDGRLVMRWLKTRQGAGEGLIEGLRIAFAEYAGLAPAIEAPTDCDDDLLTVYPLADLHLGMYAWGPETGANYDLHIARDIALNSVGQLVDQARPSKRAVLLGLGDYFHANDEKAVTPKSGHKLDVDGRWPNVFSAGAKLATAMVDLIARKHQEVDVVFLPGNHDPDAAVCLTVALALFYSATGRIRVHQEPGIAWYLRFGKVLLGATHGHTMSPERIAMMLASDRAEDWGLAEFCQVFSGHVHHEKAREVGRVRVESFGSPAARDAFNAAGGYRAGRAMHALTYHAERGEIGRHRINIAGGAK